MSVVEKRPKQWDGLPRPNEPRWQTRVPRPVQRPPRRLRLNSAVLLELLGGLALLLVSVLTYVLADALSANPTSAAAFVSRLLSFFAPVSVP